MTQKLLLPLLTLLALTSPAVLAGQTDPAQAEALARAEAEPWLATLDHGEFLESWERAAPAFQDGVSAEMWADRMGQTREMTGAVVARTFLRAQYASDIPNAPPGEYVLVEFDTQFANVGSAEEAVMLQKVEEGIWKVAGAYVRPPR